MSSFLQLALLLSRSRRMDGYRQVRAEVDALPESVFADMGMKRAQAATVARKLALR